MTQSPKFVNNGEAISTQKLKAEYAEGRRYFSYTNLTQINLQGMSLCEIDLLLYFTKLT
ncbi:MULTISPECIES: hypothetical protein [Arthrospira]|uniref:Pentapeptide repeat protein n=1 Tax=Limnospira platensis NIES-46 TaxID=1236695 RepID=A0A5M3T872_LIMPL|nr:hypothetical protein [Arthrospira platensis]MDF2210485.1 hypothetical protein [Arthrospira platensis NCB002]MDT9184271.1 hypothetical protein [Limnospira sp. PMC 289.06]MDT9296459.1 hypothetical protein [Arthrospira platensis PCC 7345]MDT9312118.1 hypothetical protein [Limnospira sp. Paracas R14]WAK74571.1 hypothetical protein AP9108_34460 [Arthrospira sp. PCC 9108]BDT12999.1 hypothetical protein N39L_27220 [Arthrospira platensis NIES-39]